MERLEMLQTAIKDAQATDTEDVSGNEQQVDASSAESETPDKEVSSVESDNNEQNEENASQEKEKNRNKGFQNRINQLTAKYKSEIEERDRQISDLEQRMNQNSQPKEAEELPEIEDTNDLLKYVNKLIDDKLNTVVDDKVSTRLTKASETLEQKQRQSKLDKLNSSFYNRVLDKYGHLFDGDVFIGSDSESSLLQKMTERFSRDPEYWDEISDKHGLDYMVKVVTGGFAGMSKKEKVEKLASDADKVKTHQGTNVNVKVSDEKPKDRRSMLMNLLTKG